MMNQDLLLLIFHYLIRHPEYLEKCGKGYFHINYLDEILEIVRPFVVQYKAPPSADQTFQLVQSSAISPELKNYLNQEAIYAIWQRGENLTFYEDSWLETNTKAFLSWTKLINGIQEAASYVKMVESDVGPETYEQFVETAKFKLTNGTNIEFTETGNSSNFFDPKTHATKELHRWSTGYDFLDRCTKGGYWAGSLWVFLGAPKAGKSRLLQNLCATSIKNGQNCFYASFELQEEIVTQRIGSNLLDIPMDDYDVASKDLAFMTQKINEFQNPFLGQKPGYLAIQSFPTSAYSVSELEQHLLKEEERLGIELHNPNFKFQNIYVDYINIMKNWRNPNSENTYMKIKQIAEDLRAIAMKHKWCIISVTQVKQSFFNSNDLDMTSASESSALGATVDFMGGIITDVFMQAAHCLYLKSILSRVSPHINERKKFDIDEPHMRLIETNEDVIHDEELAETFTKNTQNILKNYQKQKENNASQNPQNMSSDIIVNPTAKVVVGVQAVDLQTGAGLFD